MKKAFKHYHRLSVKDPDPEKVRKLFADKDDEHLIDALAHPQHSDAAKAILRDIAKERGLETGEDRVWAQHEANLYVRPFGKRPTVEEALEAPHRWRRIYRTAQVLALALLVIGVWVFSQNEKAHEQSIQMAIDAGQVDATLVSRLKGAPGLLDSEVHDYLEGRNALVSELQERYLMELWLAEWHYAPVIAERIDANENAADILPDAEAEAGDDVYFLQQAKAIALAKAFEVINEEIDTLNSIAALGVPPQSEPIHTLYLNLSTEVDAFHSELGVVEDPVVIDAMMFDHFTARPPYAPPPPSKALEVTAILLMLGAVLTWMLVGMLFWRAPRRMLLLRPFQAKKLAKPLQRFVKKNLAFHGHTLTLSDKFVNESFGAHLIGLIPTSVADLVLLPLSFIPYFRQFKRYLKVKNARSWNFLKRRLKRRKTLIRFWQESTHKTLATRCSDTWWHEVVDLLMYSCEIIVVDLSWVKSGTEWELGKIDVRDLERKTVFVVYEPKHEHAQEVVHHFWPGEEAPPPLFVFDDKGRINDAEGLQQELARIASESHLWEAPRAETAPA